MQTEVVKWLVWILDSLAIAFGVTIIVLALVRDRSRGRRRCPTCWYDMTGAPPPGLTCPECGGSHPSEASLFRTRRRWRLALLGFFIIALGYSGVLVRKAVVDGWPTAIPSAVLVTLWPVSEGDWLDSDLGTANPTDPVYAELRDRFSTGALSTWHENWWAGRLERYAKSHRRYGVDIERETLRRLVATPFTVAADIGSIRDCGAILEHAGLTCTFEHNEIGFARFTPRTRIDNAAAAMGLLCERLSTADIESATRFPQARRTWYWDLTESGVYIGHDQLVAFPDFRAVRVFHTRDIVRSGGARWDSLGSRTEPFSSDLIRDEIHTLCKGLVDSELWLPDAPFIGCINPVGDRLVVQAGPRAILAIETLLQHLRTPIDPLTPSHSSEHWSAITASLRRLESTPFPTDPSIHTVEDIVRTVEARTGLHIRQDWAFVSPVTLDNHARTTLHNSPTCAAALDEAVRCVSESKVFTAHWYPTHVGACIVPEPAYVPLEVRVYDVSALLPRASAGGLAQSPSDALRDLQILLATTVDPENWLDNAGDLNRSFTIGTLLAVVAPVRTLIQVERTLAQVATAAPKHPGPYYTIAAIATSSNHRARTCLVMLPGTPSPIARFSPSPITPTTGSTPHDEFVTNTSSASTSSCTLSIRVRHSTPIAAAASRTTPRVIPGSTGLGKPALPVPAPGSSPRAIGVCSSPSRTTNTLLTHPPAK